MQVADRTARASVEKCRPPFLKTPYSRPRISKRWRCRSSHPNATCRMWCKCALFVSRHTSSRRQISGLMWRRSTTRSCRIGCPEAAPGSMPEAYSAAAHIPTHCERSTAVRHRWRRRRSWMSSWLERLSLQSRRSGVARRGHREGNAGTQSSVAEAVRQALTVLWEVADRACGKQLKALSPMWVDALEHHRHLDVDRAPVALGRGPPQPARLYQRTLMPSEACTEDFTVASPPMLHRWPSSP